MVVNGVGFDLDFYGPVAAGDAESLGPVEFQLGEDVELGVGPVVTVGELASAQPVPVVRGATLEVCCVVTPGDALEQNDRIVLGRRDLW